MRLKHAALSIAAAAALLQSAAGQSTRPHDLGPGKFLTASRDLLDPNFAHTVVLLVRYDEDGVLGLILNRRTKVPIAGGFPDLPQSTRGGSDPIFTGGPVGRTTALALIRSKVKADGAQPVLADVSMLSGKALLEKTVAAGTGPDTFHLYAGYSGWTAGQLEKEVELGGWYIFPGDAAMVFDPDPESLWPRLIRKTEERMAFLHSMLKR